MLLNLPESVVSTGDSPSRAVVVFTMTVTAASGVTDTAAPAAPPVTSVVAVWSAVAFRPKSLPLVISDLSPASATTVLTPTFTPIEAPTPTLAAASVPTTSAPDLTVLVVMFAASMRMSPPCALTTAPLLSTSSVLSPSSAATVVLTTMLAANDPATPTLPAPAPLFASATKSLFSPVALTALMVRPLVWISAFSPTTATFVEMPTFSATAAPTPTSVLPLSI